MIMKLKTNNKINRLKILYNKININKIVLRNFMKIKINRINL